MQEFVEHDDTMVLVTIHGITVVDGGKEPESGTTVAATAFASPPGLQQSDRKKAISEGDTLAVSGCSLHLG